MGQSSYLFESIFVGVLGVAVATSEFAVKVPSPDGVAESPATAEEGVQLTATPRPAIAEGEVAIPQFEAMAVPVAKSEPRRLPPIGSAVVELPERVRVEKPVVAPPHYPTVIDENGIEWKIIDSRPCDPALCRGHVQ
ncbi:hypothetical protein Poly24_06300 [Rosistilla carotiformis]|uniref:Uncharacterized protein n=1 Tax=Rosistilla carotiformis TaxID=2528017 RepID=A0A518JN52_9BACT|nr:hypothetical protein [Rosistilla carotiformis]QDV66941.1 hypothetical protein Poly24_06300 [Rosistilla carotiformis]